jgi:replicative DNA helicase
MNPFNGAQPVKIHSKVKAFEDALIHIKARSQGKIKSLQTSWPKFDDALLDGVEWNTLTVVGARPGTGKTAFMDQLTADVVRLNPDENFRVLQFQMEMPPKTSAMRELSQPTRMSYKALNSAGGSVLTESDYKKCIAYVEELKKNPKVDIVYDPCTVNEFMSTIHDYVIKHMKEVDGKKIFTKVLVTVDHSTLFKKSDKEKDKFDMLYNLGEGLTYMKRNYPVAFVILSQLNRNIDNPDRAEEGKYGNYVLDSDVFGSDALLQHADTLIGINRPGLKKIRFYGPDRYIIPDNDTLVFHFLKSRNGDTRMSFFKLDKDLMRIVEIDTPPTQGIRTKI